MVRIIAFLLLEIIINYMVLGFIMTDKDDVEWKDKFVERYDKLTEFEEFKKMSLTYLRRSVRVNTLKADIDVVRHRLDKLGWQLKQIPWCKEGFWIEHKEGRRDIGNTSEHMLGYIYVQEAASMIPPLVLEPQEGEMILDMCAAPGSKTSQIASMMKNSGLLVSNDYKGDRIASLGINVQRVGATNIVITQMNGQWFKKAGIEFDRILVDAPCSGTGTIRKSFKTLRIWNQNMVKRLAGTQKQLIDTGFSILKKGGVLVYSTCTLEPEEDEGVITYLLSKYDDARVEEIKLQGLKRSEPVMEFEGVKFNDEVKKCLRIWPQDNDTEGFFVTKIRKV